MLPFLIVVAVTALLTAFTVNEDFREHALFKFRTIHEPLFDAFSEINLSFIPNCDSYFPASWCEPADDSASVVSDLRHTPLFDCDIVQTSVDNTSSPYTDTDTVYVCSGTQKESHFYQIRKVEHMIVQDLDYEKHEHKTPPGTSEDSASSTPSFDSSSESSSETPSVDPSVTKDRPSRLPNNFSMAPASIEWLLLSLTTTGMAVSVIRLLRRSTQALSQDEIAWYRNYLLDTKYRELREAANREETLMMQLQKAQSNTVTLEAKIQNPQLSASHSQKVSRNVRRHNERLQDTTKSLAKQLQALNQSSKKLKKVSRWRLRHLQNSQRHGTRLTAQLRWSNTQKEKLALEQVKQEEAINRYEKRVEGQHRDHNAEISQARTAHSQELAAQRETYSKHLQQVRSEHTTKLQSDTEKHQGEVENAKTEHEEKLEALRAEYKVTTGRMRSEHIDELNSENQKHLKQLQQVKDDLSTTKDELSRINEERIEDNRSQQVAAANLVNDTTKTYRKSMKGALAKQGKEFADLMDINRDEINKDHQNLDIFLRKTHEARSELEEVKYELSDLQDQHQGLQERHSVLNEQYSSLLTKTVCDLSTNFDKCSISPQSTPTSSPSSSDTASSATPASTDQSCVSSHSDSPIISTPSKVVKVSEKPVATKTDPKFSPVIVATSAGADVIPAKAGSLRNGGSQSATAGEQDASREEPEIQQGSFLRFKGKGGLNDSDWSTPIVEHQVAAETPSAPKTYTTGNKLPGFKGKGDLNDSDWSTPTVEHQVAAEMPGVPKTYTNGSKVTGSEGPRRKRGAKGSQRSSRQTPWE